LSTLAWYAFFYGTIYRHVFGAIPMCGMHWSRPKCNSTGGMHWTTKINCVKKTLVGFYVVNRLGWRRFMHVRPTFNKNILQKIHPNYVYNCVFEIIISYITCWVQKSIYIKIKIKISKRIPQNYFKSPIINSMKKKYMF
jgi:hypothetical protein